MPDVCFVSCVKRKQNKPAPAMDLYTSTYFRESKAYATQRFEYWYILSAKYGLVDPHQVIEPYDQTLKKMRIADRREWAEGVISAILRVTSTNDKLTFLTGTRYYEYLIGPLQEIGYPIHIPMIGLRFGEKVQWLQEQNAGVFDE